MHTSARRGPVAVVTRGAPSRLSLKGRALQLLAQREHSRLELRRKLLPYAALLADGAAAPADEGTSPDAAAPGYGGPPHDDGVRRQRRDGPAAGGAGGCIGGGTGIESEGEGEGEAAAPAAGAGPAVAAAARSGVGGEPAASAARRAVAAAVMAATVARRDGAAARSDDDADPHEGAGPREESVGNARLRAAAVLPPAARGGGRRAPVTPEVAARVDALLDMLEAKGWLSDARFVESRVRARSARLGTLRIRQELSRHGAELPAETARALRASEAERAEAVWRRKFGEPAVDAAGRARQLRFLAARGFDPEVVRRVVPPPTRRDGSDAGDE